MAVVPAEPGKTGAPMAAAAAAAAAAAEPGGVESARYGMDFTPRRLERGRA